MKKLPRNVIPALCMPTAAWAADGGGGGGLWLGFLLPLLVVTVGLLALLWWLRKGPGTQAGRGPLRVVQAVAVGGRERVVVIDAQDRRLLLGVTPQRVELIAELRRDDVVG